MTREEGGKKMTCVWNLSFFKQLRYKKMRRQIASTVRTEANYRNSKFRRHFIRRTQHYVIDNTGDRPMVGGTSAIKKLNQLPESRLGSVEHGEIQRAIYKRARLIGLQAVGYGFEKKRRESGG